MRKGPKHFVTKYDCVEGHLQAGDQEERVAGRVECHLTAGYQVEQADDFSNNQKKTCECMRQNFR